MTLRPSHSVRTRFAPSPTGFLHIGGVRTALFNWLYAKHFKGVYLLRIEDTDLERSEARYTEDILSSLKWLGLVSDEEVLYQAKRLDLYLKKAQELVAQGKAYYCTCTEAQVEAMRERLISQGKKPMYDRSCREKSLKPQEGSSAVIRLKIPLEGKIEFTDLIRGKISVENSEIDDFVLIRSNGAPTYNLSVVVDDVETRMTHIIRGDDHINNTPKQIQLYRYFGYPEPLFAHLPMILGPDKKKLSKRHGAVSTNLYRADGFLPEAVLNFLARLGWSHGDQEVFSLSEMIEFFDFDHVQKSSGVFNAEKLLWLNGEHLRKTSPERIQSILLEDFFHYFQKPVEIDRVRSALGLKLVALIQPKVKLIKEIAEQLVTLCTPGLISVDVQEASHLKWNKDANLKTVIQSAITRLHSILSEKIKNQKTQNRSSADKKIWGEAMSLGESGLDHQAIDQLLRQVAEESGIKLGDLAQPLRLCVTGRLVSAGLFELLEILPWDVIEPRLKMASTL